MKNFDENFEDFKKAGKILLEALAYAKKITKKDVLLLEIAEKLEEFVEDKNAKLAFPPNLSINKIAAHYSPFSKDTTVASGLLKIDIGIKYNNTIVDGAITLDLENSKENKMMIKASLEALKAATKIIKPDIEVCEIGREIEKVISDFGFRPIYNLMGHSIDGKLHGGKNIPNYDNKDKTKIGYNEVIAVEPFVTLKNASGYVEDEKPSSIWRLKNDVRPRLYRDIFNYIKQNYDYLPFSQRWLEKKFSNASAALKIFETQGILHNYKHLVEKTGAKVSQAETTFLIKEKPIFIDIFDIV